MTEKIKYDQEHLPEWQRYWLQNQVTGALSQKTKFGYKQQMSRLVKWHQRSDKEKRHSNPDENGLKNWHPCAGPETVEEVLHSKTAFRTVELQKTALAAMGEPVKPEPVPVKDTPKDAVRFVGEMSRDELNTYLAEKFPENEDEWSKLRTKGGIIKWIMEKEGGEG